MGEFKRERKGLRQSDAILYCQRMIGNLQWQNLLIAAKGDNLTIVRNGHMIEIERIPEPEGEFDRINLYVSDLTGSGRINPHATTGKNLNFEGTFVFSFSIPRLFNEDVAIGYALACGDSLRTSLSFFPGQQILDHVVVRTLNFILLEDLELSPQELMLKYSVHRIPEHPIWTRLKWGTSKPQFYLGAEEYWVWVARSLLKAHSDSVKL